MVLAGHFLSIFLVFEMVCSWKEGVPVSANFSVNASHAIPLLAFTNVINNSILFYFQFKNYDFEKDRCKWFTCNSTIDLIQSQCKTQGRAKPPKKQI